MRDLEKNQVFNLFNIPLVASNQKPEQKIVFLLYTQRIKRGKLKDLFAVELGSSFKSTGDIKTQR